VETAQATAAVGEQYNDWSIDFLADYVINQFHAYTRKMLPQLVQYADAVANAHGAHHPETITIAGMMRPLALEMLDHMNKEEKLLYPYVKQIVNSHNTGAPLPTPEFGSAEALIVEMDKEHEETGDALEQFAELSDNFAIPEDACNTYRALYNFLAEFEATTKKHIHLENNILFPKAIRMEKELAAA
ncbi:MAG TPA: hemerythrin domain-containing protein, partial [Promineifilum sp.]|nr:hemerythrin domain-containing protein [Promineifilum sp.]